MPLNNVRHEIYTKKQKSEKRTLDFVYDMCELIRRLPLPWAVDEHTRLEIIVRRIDVEVAKLARARNVLSADELSQHTVDTCCHNTPFNQIWSLVVILPVQIKTALKHITH